MLVPNQYPIKKQTETFENYYEIYLAQVLNFYKGHPFYNFIASSECENTGKIKQQRLKLNLADVSAKLINNPSFPGNFCCALE